MEFNPIANEINCGESGLSIRMFTPIVALSDKEITINGQEVCKQDPWISLMKYCHNLE